MEWCNKGRELFAENIERDLPNEIQGKLVDIHTC